jgi:hypothetical protein
MHMAPNATEPRGRGGDERRLGCSLIKSISRTWVTFGISACVIICTSASTPLARLAMLGVHVSVRRSSGLM